MKTTYRAGVAALAFAALVAQPIAANAGAPCHVPVAGPSGVVPVLWGVGFFICAGLTLGKQDAQAAKSGQQVTGKQRAHAFLGCAFPPIGLAHLVKNKPV